MIIITKIPTKRACWLLPDRREAKGEAGEQSFAVARNAVLASSLPLYEIDEAFASIPLACLRALDATCSYKM